MNKFISLVNGQKKLITAISASTGLVDAEKIISTRNDGKIDDSFLPPGFTGSLIFDFSQALINNGQFIDIEHNFGDYPMIQVYQELEQVMPDKIINLTVNVCRLDLISFIPLQGNWKAILNK
jgi:hypothetical protein